MELLPPAGAPVGAGERSRVLTLQDMQLIAVSESFQRAHAAHLDLFAQQENPSVPNGTGEMSLC